MRFMLPMAVGFALFGAVGCGDYYYPGADYPEGYNGPEESVQTAQRSGPPGSVAAIPSGAVDTSAQIEGSAGQDVMVGQTGDYADTDPSALTDFKSTLDPYGTWYDDPTYGTVWQPSPSAVGPDFAPYVTGGHWSYDDDYVWVSDYDWGWAPFHYGRWIYITGRGWSWVPGRTYAGAWVSWRVGDPDYGYVGWGPLPPDYYWYDGEAYGLGFAVYTPYTFCGRGDLFDNNLSGRVIAGPQVATVAAGTHVYVPSNRGGDGRTPANPQVGPQGGSQLGSAARPRTPFGPPPSMLGFGEHAPRPPIDNAGLLRAQQFAHASTATPLGAHGPQIASSRPTQVPYPPRGTIGAADRPVATAPQYRYPSGTHYPPPAYRGPTYDPPAARGPSYGAAPTRTYPPAYRGGSPSYSSPSAPMYRGASPSAPAYRASPSAPAYRASPSAPAYRASPSAPAYRASPSAPAYRSAPSYSAPSYRSAPSYHAPSYSSPSYSHSYSHSSGGGGRHR